MSTEAISNRAVGVYPLSIPTSLAIEGIMGVHPDRPTGKNLLPKYEVAWVNVRTLYRNLHNSIPKDQIVHVSPDEMFEALMHEMDQFERILQTESKGRMVVEFYYCKYADMKKQYPHAFLRTESTPNKITYAVEEDVCMRALLGAMGEKIHQYPFKIKTVDNRKALLLTHYPVDLFTDRIPNKALWESHTGSVKEKHKWYTKYYNGKDLMMIPFREDLIQVFGDNEHFRPMASSIRKEIVELAIQSHWSQVTTREKIVYSLDKLKNPETKALLHDLMH